MNFGCCTMLVDIELKKAKTKIKKKRILEARRILENILTVFPENNRALEALQSISQHNQNSLEISHSYQLDVVSGLYDRGMFIQTIELANTLTKSYPNSDILWNILGAANKRLNRKQEALDAFRKVAELRPHQAEGFSNLGIALCDTGHPEKALDAFSNAVRLNPAYAEAHFNRGNTLLKMGRFTAAIEAFKDALKIKSGYPKALNNLGVAFHENGEFKNAVNALKKALLLTPDYAEALNNLANSYQDLGYLNQAIEALQKAVTIRPDYSDAMKNMGNIFQNQRNYDKAIWAYREGLRISPGCSEISNNLGQLYLKLEDFEKGATLYEQRWNTKKFLDRKIRTSKPQWEGQKTSNVLLLAEQGIGDEIMYASMLSEFHSQCSNLIVQCDPRLTALFKRSFHRKITYIEDYRELDQTQFDYHISLGSLLKYLRPNLDSFSRSSDGYLVSCEYWANKIKNWLSGFGDKKLIGVSWKTASRASGSHHRNINLIDLVQRLETSDKVIVCLQYGDVSQDILDVKKHLNVDIVQLPDLDLYQNLDGLASLISVCDEVTTVDNLNVHLAGALGKQANLLLPFDGDWRWGTSKKSSYWYQSVNIVRQRKPDDWSSALDMLFAV